MSDTFETSIDHARASADALSDPVDLDNLAILFWMKRHVTFTRHHQKYVIGSETLPPAWRPEALKVAAAQDALTLLRPLKTDHTVMAGLRRALQAISPQINPTDEIVITSLAEALATQKAWIIRDARKPVAPVLTTAPAVRAALNAEGGTNVDFAAIYHWEGNQLLRGYIPFSNGKVAGKSGMSVATAFDLGQINLKEFNDLGLPASVIPKTKPFVGFRFAGKTWNDVAQFVARTAPVPVLTKGKPMRSICACKANTCVLQSSPGT